MADNKDEKEIDLLELARKLWDNKKFIIKVAAICTLLMIVIAFSIPKKYSSSVVFTTNTNTSVGNMGALASLAGINLGTQSADVLSPELYSDVMRSTPFIQGLFDLRIVDPVQGVNTTLYDYYQNKQKKAWWDYIMNFPALLIEMVSDDSGKRIESKGYISNEEKDIIESIIEASSIGTDKKTGLTTLKVVSQSPIVSAFLADTLTSYLQEYIIEQRTKKAKTDLVNSEKLYKQAKENYYKSQSNLAEFMDANMNVVSAKYRIKQEKLQNETNLAYSVYNQMAQQTQMNKIRVQDDTPVFVIIQPAIEALFPDSPKKKVMVAAVLFLSIVCSSIWILRREVWAFISK